MLVIRSSQMEAFRAHMRRQFEDRMVAHVWKVFPDQCEDLGGEVVRDAARHGIERAEAHGFSVERDVCRYVDLTFLFGRDFDTDRSLPWAAAILADSRFDDQPSARMERLWDEAKARRDADRAPDTG